MSCIPLTPEQIAYGICPNTHVFTPRGKLKLATADKKLQWRASAAGNIAVTPLYHSEA